MALLSKLKTFGTMTILQTPLFTDVTKEILFANPTLISAKVSPDGTQVASIGADSNSFVSR